MHQKLIAIREKRERLEDQLADPAVLADMDRWAKLNKEHKALGPLVETFSAFEKTEAELADARQILADATDEELRFLAKEEIAARSADLERLGSELKALLVPKSLEDEKDVIFEIRSGTGGDEAALFAGDLFKMYSRFFAENGWSVEVIDESPGALGGFSKLILDVSGEGAYGKLKFESGAHRVQRVPETEAKGRIHTSAATVAVLPKLEIEDADIRKEDLRIDVFRASGAGGQHVNRTESAVRIVHLPTGIVAESQEARSQHKNREIAMGRLVQAIESQKRASAIGAAAAARRSLVGSGDRSEKIRTYNFPQNRVTDHRLEGGSKNWPLESILSGGLTELIEALTIAENAEKLKNEH